MSMRAMKAPIQVSEIVKVKAASQRKPIRKRALSTLAKSYESSKRVSWRRRSRISITTRQIQLSLWVRRVTWRKYYLQKLSEILARTNNNDYHLLAPLLETRPDRTPAIRLEANQRRRTRRLSSPLVNLNYKISRLSLRAYKQHRLNSLNRLLTNFA